MTTNWQTWAALGVVVATGLIMAYRIFARRKSGCASGCGCEGPKTKLGAARNAGSDPSGK